MKLFPAALILFVAAATESVPAQEAPGKTPAQRLLLPQVTTRPLFAPPPLVPPALEPVPANPDANRIRPAIQIRGVIQAARVAEAPSTPPPQATALNTSEDLERLLEKATQVAAERPDLAPVLWQRILDEGANAFARTSSKNATPLRRAYEIYRPFSTESLRAMVASGPEAIRYYRLHSDGPARALLARQGPEREAALAEIVRRYFLTTVGDDAAFELGCRLLERGDFTSADQLFDRLAQYPDSSLDADEIRIRRAVAESHLGRADAAMSLIQTLSEHSSRLKPLLIAEIDRQRTAAPAGAGAAPLPAAPEMLASAAGIEPQWEFRPPWTLKGVKTTANNQAIMSGTVNGRPMIFIRQAGGNYVQTTLEDKDIPDLALPALANSWRAAGWRPASHPTLAGGRMYLKSESRTVCCDEASGKVLWMGRPTRFPIDDWSRQMALVAAHGVTVSYPAPVYMGGPQPKTMTEIMLFSDRLHHGLAVDGGRVYAIEGPLDTPATRKAAADPAAERRMAMGMMVQNQQQSRHNELACYDAVTGRLVWVVGRGNVLEEGTSLWSTPLVVGDMLLIATGADNQLGLIALKTTDGSLLWKTALADVSRSLPTIPIGLTVDDGSIYVASGAGTLFSLDRNGGALRWAVTYPRTRSNAATDRRVVMMEGGSSQRTQVVLEENFIQREGGSIVLAACDSDHVMAFDVSDGLLRWDSPLPATVLNGSPGYVVGMGNGQIVLGASRWLWGISTRGGRILWDHALDTSCGRALLTDNALLVPQGKDILSVSLKTGKVEKTIPVATPDSEPVGNLMTDGKQLLVASAARILAMKPGGASPTSREKKEAAEGTRR